MAYQKMADEIAELIEERVRIRGAGLQAKLQKSGRRLPEFIKNEANVLVRAAALQGSPKLARQINQQSTLKSYNACKKYLDGVDAKDRRSGNIVGFFSTNAFNLLVITALVILVLRWRGFL